MNSHPNKSCLYLGHVVHHRQQPKKYYFKMRLFMFLVHVKGLNRLALDTRLLSHNRFNLFSFFDRDYLKAWGDSSATLDKKIENYLTSQGIKLKNPNYYLLTHLRMIGYVFNPVSFYYCFEGDQPRFAFAEVTNTFKERKIFPIFWDSNSVSFKKPGGSNQKFSSSLKKNFYVSPFSVPQTDFHFELNFPFNSNATDLFVDKLRATVTESKRGNDKKYFRSYFEGYKMSIDTWSLLRCLIFYPGQTLLVTLMIHFHAFFLWCRRFPYFSKDAFKNYQTDWFKETKNNRR